MRKTKEEILEKQWGKAFDNSGDALSKLADEALEEHHAGRTKPMNETISVTELAEKAGVSRQTIHLLIDMGKKGPFPGARRATPGATSPYLIPIDEAEDWLKKRDQS